ncbi:MAG: PTPA-CTERM sorting domain-containing protein [Lyngbya sp. HA4199-MV5]|jgi:hypothetical protein|nr:PTPA-CTERM sorting domain-containing protein [Lyngbya sp. HA4199-MV5]
MNQTLSTFKPNAKSLLGFTAAVGMTALAVGSTVAPAGAFTVFTNRAAWQTAIGSGYTISDDTFSTPIADAPSITFDSGIVSTGTGGNGTKFNGVQNSGEYKGGLKRPGVTNGAPAGFFEKITWTFTDPVKGFFADWRSINALLITGNFDGTGPQTINLRNALGGPNGGFGLIGEKKFTEITFTLPVANNSRTDNFFVDNLAVAVPTPALLPGLIGLGIGAWRKRKSEQTAEAEANT